MGVAWRYVLFSPLIIHGYGVVDSNIEELDAYIYRKIEGMNVGNHVCSLLQNSLKRKRVFKDSESHGPGNGF